MAAEQYYTLHWPDLSNRDADFYAMGDDDYEGTERPLPEEAAYRVMLALPREGFGIHPKAVFSLSQAAVVSQLALYGIENEAGTAYTAIDVDDYARERLLVAIENALRTEYATPLGTPRFDVSPSLHGSDYFNFSVDLIDQQLTPLMLSKILKVDLFCTNTKEKQYPTAEDFFKEQYTAQRMDDVAGFMPIAKTNGLRTIEKISAADDFSVAGDFEATGFVVGADDRGRVNQHFNGIISVKDLRLYQSIAKRMPASVFQKNTDVLKTCVVVDWGTDSESPYSALLEGNNINRAFSDTLSKVRFSGVNTFSMPFLQNGTDTVVSSIHDPVGLKAGGGLRTRNTAMRRANDVSQFINDGVRLFFASTEAAQAAGFSPESIRPATEVLGDDAVVVAAMPQASAWVACPSVSASPALTTAIAVGVIQRGSAVVARSLSSVVDTVSPILRVGTEAVRQGIMLQGDTQRMTAQAVDMQTVDALADSRGMQSLREQVVQGLLTAAKGVGAALAEYNTGVMQANPTPYQTRLPAERFQAAMTTSVVMQRLSTVSKHMEEVLAQRFADAVAAQAAQKMGLSAGDSVNVDKTALKNRFSYWGWVEAGGSPDTYITAMEAVAQDVGSWGLDDDGAAPWYREAIAVLVADDDVMESAYFSIRGWVSRVAKLNGGTALVHGELLTEIADKQSESNALFARELLNAERVINERARAATADSVAQKQQALTERLTVSSAPAQRIEDFGEKIGGAHKDRRGRVSVEAIQASNDIELALLASKNALWPALDMREQIDSGVPLSLALLRKVVKNVLPTEAGEKDREGCTAYIEAVQQVRDICMEAESVADALADLLVYALDKDHIYGQLVIEANGTGKFDRTGARWGGKDPLTPYVRGKRQGAFHELYQGLTDLALSRYSHTNTHFLAAIMDTRDPTRAGTFNGKVTQAINVRLTDTATVTAVREAFKQDLLDFEAKRLADNPALDAEDNGVLLAAMQPFSRELPKEGLRLARARNKESRLTHEALEKRFGTAYPWNDTATTLLPFLRESYELVKPKKKTDAELESLNRTRQFDAKPHLANIEREGKDWRNGADVSPDIFTEMFGFRGVEFGEWVTQGERQTLLNFAYDSFMDLAEVHNLPPAAMSLGGELALAFGSRGRKGAAAHFEPARNVINLTRMSGAGALSHEFAHALDHFWAKQLAHRGQQEPYFLTDASGTQSSMRSFLRGVSPEQQATVEAAMEALRQVRQNSKTPVLTAENTEVLGKALALQVAQWATSWLNYGQPPEHVKSYDDRLTAFKQAVGIATDHTTSIRDAAGAVLHESLLTSITARRDAMLTAQCGSHTPWATDPDTVAKALQSFVSCWSVSTEDADDSLEKLDNRVQDFHLGSVAAPTKKDRRRPWEHWHRGAEQLAVFESVAAFCREWQAKAPEAAEAQRKVLAACTERLCYWIDSHPVELQKYLPSEQYSYHQRTVAADKIVKKGKAYYSTPVEQFARVFESVTYHKLAQRGDCNQYLVNGVDPDRQAAICQRWNGENLFVYLTPEEIPEQEKAVDALMEQTRECVLDALHRAEASTVSYG